MEKTVKKSKFLSFVSLLVCMVFLSMFLTACQSQKTDFSQEMPGKRYKAIHWGHRVKDGEDGFYKGNHYYTFNEDGTFLIDMSEDEDYEDQTGKYEFTSKTTLTMSYDDGSVENITLEIDNHNAIVFQNDDTHYADNLEGPITD